MPNPTKAYVAARRAAHIRPKTELRDDHQRDDRRRPPRGAKASKRWKKRTAITPLASITPTAMRYEREPHHTEAVLAERGARREERQHDGVRQLHRLQHVEPADRLLCGVQSSPGSAIASAGPTTLHASRRRASTTAA